MNVKVLLPVVMAPSTSKTLTKQMKAYLQKIYTDPKSPVSFRGVESVYRFVQKAKKNISRKLIKEWLMTKDSYTLHKPVRKKFKTRKVIVQGIDDQWQADLADLGNIAKYNKGYRYILTCIDVFSKYAWVIPVKTKTGVNVTSAFEAILKTGRKPVKLQTDQGKEFLNKIFQALLKEENVHFFTTHSERKASVVERFNRTFKSIMWRYLTSENTLSYVDVLPELVYGYNHAYHRSIGISPVQVTPGNEEQVWQRLYGEDKKRLKFRYRVGDSVRISKARSTFSKGYEKGWTEEIFTISRQLKQNPVVYKLSDYEGKQLDGTFYEPELQQVLKTSDVYTIEKIISKRKRGKKLWYYVKWLGYPKSMNSWVEEKDLQSV